MIIALVANCFIKSIVSLFLIGEGFFVILNFFDIFAVVKEQLNIKY